MHRILFSPSFLSLFLEALFLLYQAPPPTAPPMGAFVGASQHSEGILAGEGSYPERATAPKLKLQTFPQGLSLLSLACHKDLAVPTRVCSQEHSGREQARIPFFRTRWATTLLSTSHLHTHTQLSTACSWGKALAHSKYLPPFLVAMQSLKNDSTMADRGTYVI